MTLHLGFCASLRVVCGPSPLPQISGSGPGAWEGGGGWGALAAPGGDGKLWKLTKPQPGAHSNPRPRLWTCRQLWLQPAGSEEIL